MGLFCIELESVTFCNSVTLMKKGSDKIRSFYILGLINSWTRRPFRWGSVCWLIHLPTVLQNMAKPDVLRCPSCLFCSMRPWTTGPKSCPDTAITENKWTCLVSSSLLSCLWTRVPQTVKLWNHPWAFWWQNDIQSANKQVSEISKIYRKHYWWRYKSW